MRRLWTDERGMVLSAELILLITMLVIGLTAGLKVLQSAINTELADVANAVAAISQGYSWSPPATTWSVDVCGNPPAPETP